MMSARTSIRVRLPAFALCASAWPLPCDPPDPPDPPDLPDPPDPPDLP